MDPSSGGIGASKPCGPDRRIEDRGTGRIESGGEINLMGLGTNLMANTNEDFPPDIGAAAFPLPPVEPLGTHYVRIPFQILKLILVKLSASKK